MVKNDELGATAPDNFVWLQEPSAAPRSGEKYVVQTEVGRGAMGRVLAVRDRDLNRDVAMKVMLPRESSPHLVERFVDEAQITGQLEHPNVLPVHDFGANAEGELYFTMKYVKEHENLANVIEMLRKGDAGYHERYSFERRVQIIQDVCHALSYAHARGVVHRDVKPANIIIGTTGEVFLADWGVAKVKATDDGSKTIVTRPVMTTRDESSTVAGAIIGSLGYMSPEQLESRHDEVDARADVYGLCAVLYELLSLHHYLDPIEEKTPAAVLERVRAGKVRPASGYWSRRNGRVPRMLAKICEHGLTFDRARRIPDTRSLEHELQRWLEGRGVIVCPGTAIQRVLCGVIRIIDAHPFLAPTIAIGGSLAVAGLAILGLVRLFGS